MNDGYNNLGVKRVQDTLGEAHAALTRAIGEVSHAPDALFCSHFEALVDLLEAAFRVEESLMESCNYCAVRGHREEHARVLATLHQLEPRIEQGQLEIGHQALELLPQ